MKVLIRLIVVLTMLSFSLSCKIFSNITDGIELKPYPMPEQGVTLAVPVHWQTTLGGFYQLASKGKLKRFSNIGFDYRGLPHNLNGLTAKKQYAKGWYDAFLLSYRKQNARFLEKNQNLQSPLGTFQFIGEYEDPELGKMIRFGILHFRHKRVHTIYYTAPREGYEVIFSLFRLMEERHRYYKAE